MKYPTTLQGFRSWFGKENVKVLPSGRLEVRTERGKIVYSLGGNQ